MTLTPDELARRCADLETTLQSVPDALFELDEQGRFMNAWTHNASNPFLMPKGQFLGRTVAEMLPAAAAKTAQVALTEAAEKGHSHGQIIRLLTAHGVEWFELSTVRKQSPDGGVRFIVSSRNVTQRHRIEEARQQAIAHNEQLLAEADRMRLVYLSMLEDNARAQAQLRQSASVFEHTHEGILITDAQGTILDVNQAFMRITGYQKEEVLGRKPRVLRSGRHEGTFYQSMWQHMLSHGHWNGEIWNRRKNGEVYAELLTISAVYDPSGQVQRYVGLFTDITALKEQEQQLEQMAHYDPLTHLPNRTLLADRLQQAMAHTHRRDTMLAVVYLDLDGFKAVNDTHGHEAGDALLSVLGTRMQQVLRTGDTLARMGGDEFVAVLIDLPSPQACTPVLQRLLVAAAAPVEVAGHALHVSASVGVSFYPQADESVQADQLLRQADQAMYQAKQAGRNRYHLFDAEHDQAVRRHYDSIERVRVALQHEEFVLHFQPKVHLRSGRVTGVEALIRWQHPQRGLLLPAEFLSIIAERPLGVQLGDWVLRTALSQSALWRAQGLHLPISVNIGAFHLQQPDFVPRLAELLRAQTGFQAGDLELEILETGTLKNIDHMSQLMRKCTALGVDFALDDFGTGHSSLTYLRRLPTQLLKIDHSFIRNMLQDPDDLAILEGILGMAQAFRRPILAEGIETVAHGKMLLQMGCTLGQGHAIAMPMPADALPDWLHTWQAPTVWRDCPPVGRDKRVLLYAMTEIRAYVCALYRYLHAIPDHTASEHDLQTYQFSQWSYLNHPTRTWQLITPAQIHALHAHLHDSSTHLLALHEQGQCMQAQQGFHKVAHARDALLAELERELTHPGPAAPALTLA